MAGLNGLRSRGGFDGRPLHLTVHRMRALLLAAQGPIEENLVLHHDVPAPGEPGEGQLLIAVAACGVNPVDWKLMNGGLPAWFAFPHIPGLDVAGTVCAIGPGIVGFSLCDRVCAHLDLRQPGGFADLVPSRMCPLK